MSTIYTERTLSALGDRAPILMPIRRPEYRGTCVGQDKKQTDDSSQMPQ